MITLSGPTTDFAVISVAEVKAYAEAKTSDDDTLLTSLTGYINRAIFTSLGGRFIKATGTPFDQVYDGPGRELLYLDQYPVISVTSVEEGRLIGSGVFTVTRTFVATDFQIEKTAGGLYRTSGLGSGWAWPAGRHVVRVVYLAGYSPIPEDLREAAMLWAVTKFRRIRETRPDLLSVARETESMSYTTDDAPLAVKLTLAKYRRIEVSVG